MKTKSTTYYKMLGLYEALLAMLFLKSGECYSSQLSFMGNLFTIQGIHTNTGSYQHKEEKVKGLCFSKGFFPSPPEYIHNFGSYSGLLC